ncbi:hypothetical protein F1215_010870 [Escherichia coli]|uniref:hypothetical protein n=1 Tax=Escherichia coli TaxID=562 RepID=UPI0021D4E3A5|nr:hypothetical protein [Escherichia coli]
MASIKTHGDNQRFRALKNFTCVIYCVVFRRTPVKAGTGRQVKIDIPVNHVGTPMTAHIHLRCSAPGYFSQIVIIAENLEVQAAIPVDMPRHSQ